MLFAANFKHTFVSWANARSSISILPKDSVMHFYGPYVVAQKQLKMMVKKRCYHGNQLTTWPIYFGSLNIQDC